MKRTQKPKRTAFEKKREKANAIRELMHNENDRHARKISSLKEQVAAARGFKSDDLKSLAIVRLEGQQEDEKARHRQRRENLEARLRKALQ